MRLRVCVNVRVRACGVRIYFNNTIGGEMYRPILTHFAWISGVSPFSSESQAQLTESG